MKLYEQMVLAGLTQQVELYNESGYSSKNLYEQISLLTEDQQKAIHLGLAWLQQHGLQDDVVIVGGTAVVCHIAGGRTLTPDLDLLVKDVGAFAKMLSQEKIPYAPLANAAMVDSLRFSGITVDAFNADFMVWDNKKLNALVFQTAGGCNIAGAGWKVIDPTVLMCLKSMSGRTKDMEDMRRLWQASKDKARVQKMVKQLIGIGLMTREDYEDMKAFMF